MKVAVYARVSTDEQRKHGLSIDAQLSDLRKWAADNHHTIIREYVDAGISGKKPYSKRPALSSFMTDLENGLDVDALVFTKLDRFYRSVRLYYQAVDVLERHKVAWQAIQEDYETITASGRFKVNIMLAVAEDEADRTSERIRAVFDHKIANGECVNPNGLPLGYSVKDKKVVPDEYAQAAINAFENYATHGNKGKVQRMLWDDYGINLPILSVTNLLRNRLYIGEYRTNLNFCQPLISRSLFFTVQRDLDRRSTRKTPSGFEYLFTGLIVCRECGKRMCSASRPQDKEKTAYYRCPTHYMRHICPNHKMPKERKIESFLLTHIEKELQGKEYEYHLTQEKTPSIDRTEALQKLNRLKDLYVDGLITKDQYKADYDRIQAQLQEPTPPPDFATARRLIGDAFGPEYQSFTREQKKTLWRAVLDRLEVDKDGTIYIYFR